MKVTFRKTHPKGYSVSVEGPGIARSKMDPAPGFHPRLPHDAAHFIVESELGIEGGIYGQLARGGLWASFFAEDTKRPRKAKKASKELFKQNEVDALFSEHAVYAAQSRWERQQILPDTKISESTLRRICEKFDEFAERWSALDVGESITLEWKPHNQKLGSGRG